MTTLSGWTLPQTPTGRVATVPPPPWHYSGEVIAVDFVADPARVAELVPPGFTPRGDGSCTFTFCDWASAADRDPRVKNDPAKGQYKEAFVTLHGTRGGARKAPGERFAAHVSSLGRRLATVSVTIRGEANGALQGSGPLIHTRHWPSLEGETPAIHELSLVNVADAENGTVWRGDATLEIGGSEFEELELLAPRSVGSGWVYSTAFSVTGGKTLSIGGVR